MKTYRIKMFVYNRGVKNGKAFGVKFKSGYFIEVNRSYETLEQAIAWVDDIHTSGLLWVYTWDIKEVE